MYCWKLVEQNYRKIQINPNSKLSYSTTVDIKISSFSSFRSHWTISGMSLRLEPSDTGAMNVIIICLSGEQLLFVHFEVILNLSQFPVPPANDKICENSYLVIISNNWMYCVFNENFPFDHCPFTPYASTRVSLLINRQFPVLTR